MVIANFRGIEKFCIRVIEIDLKKELTPGSFAIGPFKCYVTQ